MFHHHTYIPWNPHLGHHSKKKRKSPFRPHFDHSHFIRPGRFHVLVLHVRTFSFGLSSSCFAKKVGLVFFAKQLEESPKCETWQERAYNGTGDPFDQNKCTSLNLRFSNLRILRLFRFLAVILKSSARILRKIPNNSLRTYTRQI